MSVWQSETNPSRLSMSALLKLAVTVAIVAGVMIAFSATAFAVPNVTITIDDVCGLNTTHEIKWSCSESDSGTVKIELLQSGDGNQSAVAIAGTVSYSSGKGSYTWTVPSDLSIGTYRVKITSNEEEAICGESPAFNIVNPLAITGPVGGSILKTGETAGITWSCMSGFTGTVNLKLLKNGAEVKTIAASLDATARSYSWTLPDGLTLGTDYQIQVASNEYPSIKAVSSNITINCAVSGGHVLLGYEGPSSDLKAVAIAKRGVAVPIAMGQTVSGTFDNNTDYLIDNYNTCNDYYILITDGTQPLHFEMEVPADASQNSSALVFMYNSDGTCPAKLVFGCVFEQYMENGEAIKNYKLDDYFIPKDSGYKSGPYILMVRGFKNYDYKLRVTTTVSDTKVSFPMNGGDAVASVQTGSKGEWTQTLDLNHTTGITGEKSGYTIEPFTLSSKSDFTGDIKMYATPAVNPAVTGFVLDKSAINQGEIVNATIQTSGLADGTPVYVFLLNQQENIINMSPAAYYGGTGSLVFYSGMVTDNQATVPVKITEGAGEYTLRAQIAGTAVTMSRGITVTGAITPVISSVQLSSDRGLAGRANQISINLATANVPDGTMARVELTDANGVIVRPLVFTVEKAISGGTAQFDLILPSDLSVGSYKLRAVAKMANYPSFSAAYTVYQNDLAITSFVVPGQLGDSVIDSQAHTVVFTMPYGSDIGALVPNVKFNGDTISPLSGTAQDFKNATKNTINYTLTTVASDRTTVTSTQSWAVTCVVKAAPSIGTAITAFSLPGQSSAQIDVEHKTITVTMPVGTSLSSLAATFTLSDGASVKVSGVTQQSGVTANSFRKEVVYAVTAEDNIATADWKVIVSSATPRFILKDGALNRSAGLMASITALSSEGLAHEGTEKVVFALLKDGQKIRTVEVNIDIQSEEKVYAYFNVTGSEYTVRATVVDSADKTALSASADLQ